MKLLILGAGGRTGRLLVDQAVTAGHAVTGFVRSKPDEGDFPPGVAIVVGDARNETDLKKALKDQEAIISTVGSSKPGDRVVAASTAALINSAEIIGVKRVIVMSSFLVTQNFQPHPIVKFILGLMNTIVKDINSGEELLRRSSLDYTIVYATRLTNNPFGPRYKIVSESEKIGASDKISRADAADFLLKQLYDKRYIRKSVIITDK